MKILSRVLSIIMASFTGVFIGHSVYILWNHHTHPELYAMQSAPWYTSILAYGAATLALLLLCGVMKGVVFFLSRRRSK